MFNIKLFIKLKLANPTLCEGLDTESDFNQQTKLKLDSVLGSGSESNSVLNIWNLLPCQK